ncbi:MAG: DUF2461 domain-containing protein [Rhizobiales bacterium]|nr:DUF2461 domain-containing protein [Hyphomicrobiales bacterium]
MSAPSFAGFSPAAIKFLGDLRANNNRAWFATHKVAYEHEIKLPAEAFCSAMSNMLAELTGRPHAARIFRIHRDVRFSKDKTPYNAHLHIAFTPEGKAAAPPLWFFGLDPDKLSLGTGLFAFDKDGLDRFRQRIDGPEGEEIVALLGELQASGVRLCEPDLKRVPAGFAQDHPRADLLCRKSLAAWIDVDDPSAACRPDLIATCRAAFVQLRPVFDLLLDEAD